MTLTESQKVAIQNTVALKNEAMRRAAAPYEKQLQAVASEAVTAAGHGLDTHNWKLSTDGKSLIGEPATMKASK